MHNQPWLFFPQHEESSLLPPTETRDSERFMVHQTLLPFWSNIHVLYQVRTYAE